jgi:hypothetical protein
MGFFGSGFIPAASHVQPDLPVPLLARSATFAPRLTNAGLWETVPPARASRVNRLRHLGTTLENGQLLRRHTVRTPTLRGWLRLLSFAALTGFVAVRSAHPFLALPARVPARVLVVEGWAMDTVLQAGLDEFRRGGYRDLICTGGPLEKGETLSSYGSFAEIGRSTLERLGAPTDAVHAVPAPRVKRDRTHASAIPLRDWLRRHHPGPIAFNLRTTDTHARRTRLLFQRAFGEDAQIGIIAVPDDHFDESQSRRSSEGFKAVLVESLAYISTRLVFPAVDDRQGPSPIPPGIPACLARPAGQVFHRYVPREKCPKSLVT